MRVSRLFTKTTKNVPADETAKNAQLLIQAGYIHKEMAGVYSYLPLGLSVLNKIAGVVRGEMNKVGGQEVQMTILQPKDIWEKTGRWDDKVVDNWFKTKLANGTELGIGLTHEEPLVDILKSYVNSYKDLPLSIYQIQPKFRNELRAKSGVLRGREFLMKDLYTFSRNQQEHEQIYETLAGAYHKVYARLGLGDITYRTFASGGIFSKFSDEFQTLSEVGEDTIYLNKAKKIAVNKEVYTDEVLEEIGLKKADLEEVKAVEVGNIFSLGSKYTDALNLKYVDENGAENSIIMGCYGIGVSRLLGIIAEHFADDRGIVWPEEIAPYKVYLASLGDDKKVISQTEQIYEKLNNSGIEVLFDDRSVRPGEKFADADLLGIPYRLVISEKTLEQNKIELKKRTEKDTQLLEIDKIINLLAD